MELGLKCWGVVLCGMKGGGDYEEWCGVVCLGIVCNLWCCISCWSGF